MSFFGHLYQTIKPERLYASQWYYKFKDTNLEHSYLFNKFDAKRNIYFMIQCMLLFVLMSVFLFNMIYRRNEDQFFRGAQLIIVLIALYVIYKQKERFMQILAVIQFIYDMFAFNFIIRKNIVTRYQDPVLVANFILLFGVRYTFQLIGYMVCSNNIYLQIGMLFSVYIVNLYAIYDHSQNYVLTFIISITWNIFSFFILIQLEVRGRNAYYQNLINEKKHQSWKKILDEKIQNSIFVVTYGTITNLSTSSQITIQNGKTSHSTKIQIENTEENCLSKTKQFRRSSTIDKKRIDNCISSGINKNLLHLKEKQDRESMNFTLQSKNTVENSSRQQDSSQQKLQQTFHSKMNYEFTAANKQIYVNNKNDSTQQLQKWNINENIGKVDQSPLKNQNNERNLKELPSIDVQKVSFEKLYGQKQEKNQLQNGVQEQNKKYIVDDRKNKYNFIFSPIINEEQQQQYETPYLEAPNNKQRQAQLMVGKEVSKETQESNKVNQKKELVSNERKLQNEEKNIFHQQCLECQQDVNMDTHNKTNDININFQKKSSSSDSHQSIVDQQNGLIFPFFNNYFVKTFKNYDEKDYQKNVIERIELIHDGKKMTLYEKIKEIMMQRYKQQQPQMINQGLNANAEGSEISSELPNILQSSEIQEKLVFPGCYFQDQNMYFDIQISQCTWGQLDHDDGLIVILNDISQRVTNQRLKQLDKYKDDLLASVSHDFKTPLNGMAAQLQLITTLLKNVFTNNYNQPALKTPKNQLTHSNQDSERKQIMIKQSFSEVIISNKDKDRNDKTLNDDQIQVSEISNETQDDFQNQIFNYLYQVEQNVWLLNHLVNDIQDYSQMNNQTLRINVCPYRLQDVVNDVQNLIKIQSDAKGIAFEVNSKIPLDSIQLNSDKIRLNNALKFTYEGHVKLEIDQIINEEAQYNTLQFSVSDTGIGMSEAVQTSLFKMYSTYDTNKINKYGVGLGLFISKCLVTLLGPINEIQVQSVEGQGSIFKFQIYQYLDQSKKRRGTSIINQSYAKTNKSENNYTILYSNNIGLNTPKIQQFQPEHQQNINQYHSPNINSFSLKNAGTNGIGNGNVQNNIFINTNYPQNKENQQKSLSLINTPSSQKQGNLIKYIITNNNLNLNNNLSKPSQNLQRHNSSQNQQNIKDKDVSKHTKENKINMQANLNIIQKLCNICDEGSEDKCEDNDSQPDRNNTDSDDTIAFEEVEGGIKTQSKYFTRISHQQGLQGKQQSSENKRWGFVQTKYKSENCISNQNQQNSFSNHKLISSHHKLSSSPNSKNINSYTTSQINSAQKLKDNNIKDNTNKEFKYTLLQPTENKKPNNKKNPYSKIYTKSSKPYSGREIPEINKYPSQNNQKEETTFQFDVNQFHLISERNFNLTANADYNKTKFEQRGNMHYTTLETEQNLIGNNHLSNNNIMSNILIQAKLNDSNSSEHSIQEGTVDEYNKQQNNFHYINSQNKPKTLLQLIDPLDSIQQIQSFSNQLLISQHKLIQHRPSLNQDKDMYVSIDIESLKNEKNNQDISDLNLKRNVFSQTERQNLNIKMNDIGSLLNLDKSITPNSNQLKTNESTTENDILNPTQQQIVLSEQFVDESNILMNKSQSISQNTTQQIIKIRSNEFKEFKMKRLPNRKLRLLYAEDELFSVVAIKNFLKEYEKYIDLTVVFNGQLALNKIIQQNSEQRPFDAVFMDANMPIMSGPETIQQIRKLIDQQAIDPLIIITCTSYTDKQRFLDLGSDNFLSKPTNLQSILEALIFIINKMELNLININ